MAFLLGGRSTRSDAMQDRVAVTVYREPAMYAGSQIQLVAISQRDKSREYYLGVVDAVGQTHLMHVVGYDAVIVYRALRILSAILKQSAPGTALNGALVDRCLAAARANLDPSDARARQDVDWAVVWIGARNYMWIMSFKLADLPEAIRTFRRDNIPTGRTCRPSGYTRRH